MQGQKHQNHRYNPLQESGQRGRGRCPDNKELIQELQRMDCAMAIFGWQANQAQFSADVTRTQAPCIRHYKSTLLFRKSTSIFVLNLNKLKSSRVGTSALTSKKHSLNRLFKFPFRAIIAARRFRASLPTRFKQNHFCSNGQIVTPAPIRSKLARCP